MIKRLYFNAFSVVKRHFFLLWGISLLNCLLCGIAYTLFGVIPGVALCISMLLESAMYIIYLRAYRGGDFHCIQLFDMCRDWHTVKRMLGGMGWMYLWIFIWALIPIAGIVFAIIRSYEYRLTPYILANEPDVSATQAIKVSSAKTRGSKARMFGADMLLLAFLIIPVLVILLLFLLPNLVILIGGGRLRISSAAFVLILIVDIVFVILAPIFSGLVHAGFYEELSSRGVCPQCGASIDPSSAFCSSCGASLDGSSNASVNHDFGGRACPRCGAPLEEGSLFCAECGCKLDES